MSSDSFTTVTRESWFSRLKNSFLGVLFGILMFLGSFVVLWWNEGRSVHTAQALVELKNSVVTIEADHVEPQNEGKPVHLSGSATTERTLTDDLFGISAQAIKLRRKVEMYQWREEKKEEKRDKVGGSQETVTTYRYSKQWSQQQYNSDAFQQSDTHQNPRSMRVESEQKVGEPVTVGAFTLSAGLLSQMSNYETLTLAKDWQLPEAEQKSGVIQGHTVYVSQMAGGTPPNPDQPAIGDLRVSWEVVPSGPVSVIAQQTKASFAPWQASSAKGLGTQVERLVNGVRSAPEMVEQLESENRLLTWILRGVGYFVMAFGIIMVLQPFAVLASFLPFLGKISRGGIAIFAFFVALALSLVTIAMAWIAYRPVLAGSLIAAAAAVLILFVWLARRRPTGTPEGP